MPTETTKDPAVTSNDFDKPVITLIRHHHNSAELFDNAVTHLTNRGFDIQHRYPFDGDVLHIPESGVTPTIVLGGGQNITDLAKYDYLHDELRWIEACLVADTPVLGLCLGSQMIAHVLGSTVSARTPEECEFGFYTIYPTSEAGNWLPDAMPFMQAHYQEFSLPEGAVRLAYSDRYSQQAFRYGCNTYAMQFHPEVNGAIFDNWLADSWSDEMASTFGAQDKSAQRKAAASCLAAQQRWFSRALDDLFCS